VSDTLQTWLQTHMKWFKTLFANTFSEVPCTRGDSPPR